MISSTVLRAMLSAGATAEMIVVAVEADCIAEASRIQERREYERERKRNYRVSQMSPGQPGTTGTKEKVSHTLPKENITPLSSPKGEHIPPTSTESYFDAFWRNYPRKVGKGAALKAYRNAVKRATPEEIAAGLARYKPDPNFTKHASTWLNADCWLDEDKPATVILRGPWKPLNGLDDGPPISEAERQANMEKLAPFMKPRST